MKILIIGGTRLLGKAIVIKLKAAGHFITVVSRSHQEAAPGIECIEAERTIGLERLRGREFDITIDFIAYDKAAIKQVFQCVNCGLYIFISSTWVTRLAANIAADQPVLCADELLVKSISKITSSYLIGKLRAESEVLEIAKRTGAATILRLPIFWGENEHTGRLDFYRQRILDGYPIICVDGGQNKAQLVWVEDVAAVVPQWIMKAAEKVIWEALPDKSTKVREIITTMALGKGKKRPLIDIPSKQLFVDLPEYLSEEPLWHETACELTDSNLFAFIGVKPTPISMWLSELMKRRMPRSTSYLRSKELEFFKTIN
ncbi:MAG: NAD-dependent epimerase/dehydratase family protein [Candidatus Margulisiibacteriota bacterium]